MSSVPSYGSWLPPAAGPPAEPPSGPPPSADGDPARWAPWTAPASLAVAFLFALVGALVVGTVGALFGASFEDPPPAVNIAATIVQDAAFIGAAVLFAGRTGRVLPAQFGLVRTRLRTAIGWTLLAYVAYLVLGQLWAQVVDIDAPDSLPDSLGVDQSTAALVAVCVLVTVIAPIAEEVFFRGYFYGALRNWRGPWPAALGTGVVFGAVHAFGTEAVFLVPLAILGFMLCVVRERTGSLLPCIVLHAINNALAFSIAENWSAGAGALLVAGSVAATLLLCAAVMQPRARRA